MTDENHMTTNSYNSNGGNMSHTPPAPSRHFAGMFTELESSLADERRDWFNNRHALLLDNLLACIREQQAALAACLGQAKKGPIPEITRWEEARAVLEKWRIK
jgi:hypothetical protein